MRSGIQRGLAGAMLAGIMLLTATACANPPAGTDGDLVNEWPVFTAPEGWMPKVGACHKEFAAVSHRRAYSPLECTAEHRYETTHLGEFTGTAAKLASPPGVNTAELADAWKECDAKTTAYLGDDWRNGRIQIGVSVPSSGAWEGGARWFRCEASTTQHYDLPQISLTRSLKGEFSGASDLRLGCLQLSKDPDQEWVTASCTGNHNAEFVGAVTMSGTYDDLETSKESLHGKCRSAIAAYVGVPDNGDMKYRTGTAYHAPSREEWNAGDHSVRCYLWLSNKTLTKSLKGGGPSALPIN